MTKPEVRQLKKSTALNKIRDIYNPKTRFKCDQYDRSSFPEQRDDAVMYIIEQLERELNSLK